MNSLCLSRWCQALLAEYKGAEKEEKEWGGKSIPLCINSAAVATKHGGKNYGRIRLGGAA